MCFLAICMSLEKYLFRPFYHVLIGLFVFLALSCLSSLCILEIYPLSFVSFAIIVSHSEGCLFTLLIVSFAVQKLLSLIRSHLFIFISITCFDLCHRMFCLFSSKSFRVSGLTFRFLIHFEFIFVYGIRKYSNFILLRVVVQFS